MRFAQRVVRAAGRRLVGAPQTGRVDRLVYADAGSGYDAFGMHRDWVQLARGLLRPIYHHYFRVSSYGTEHVPATGPALLVANHSGTLPFDAAVICLDVLEHTEPPRLPRPIADRFVPRMPFAGSLASRVGVVAGVLGNVQRLIEHGELCLIFPEGTSAIGKPWRERYRLQGWHTGHAELALRFRVPVIPVAVIGAEEQWPQLGRIAAHPFGIPYVPIVATPLPLPVHYRIYYGAAVRFEPGSSDVALSMGAIERAADATRTAVQMLVEQGLAARKGIFT